MNSTRFHVHHHHHHPYHPLGPIPAFPESPPEFPGVIPPNNQHHETEEGLGVPAILFLAIGGAVLFLVILACIYLTWRHSRTRSRELSTFKQESNKVGRAIQRASFFPRFSQYWNQPVVVPYPDPDSHLPNYPIRTPYTFSSSSTLASTPGSIRLLETPDSSSILNSPSYRATIH